MRFKKRLGTDQISETTAYYPIFLLSIVTCVIITTTITFAIVLNRTENEKIC